MRLALVTSGDPSTNPRCRPLLTVLQTAGHDVTVISPPVPEPLEGVEHIRVGPTRLQRWRARLTDGDAGLTAIARATARTAPDLIYPLRRRDVTIADAVRGPWALTRPGWASPRRDFVWAGPSRQGLATIPQGVTPTSGPVHIVARFTATTPANYLASGFEALGVQVRRWDGEITWGDVESESAAVIFVESPYPELGRMGRRQPGVPVLFWVHHGEHHQAANLRLADRYGADAVLLAHSWHLAHQYRQPAYALPFAVPMGLAAGTARQWEGREVDVAMVGAGLHATEGWYARRAARIEAIEADDSIRSFFRYGLPPGEMLDVYGRARIVINDGGTQHWPITMRVFEAIGAGAALATEPAPGLSSLLDEGTDYSVLTTTGVGEIRALLDDPDLGRRASTAHRRATERHTYEVRARQILRIAAAVEVTEGGHGVHRTDIAGVSSIVDRDVEPQSIVVDGDVGAGLDLPDRDVRRRAGASYRPGSFDAAVVGRGASLDTIELAREYVYVSGDAADLIDEARQRLATWDATEVDGWWRFDAGGGGYRVRPDDHPLR